MCETCSALWPEDVLENGQCPDCRDARWHDERQGEFDL